MRDASLITAHHQVIKSEIFRQTLGAGSPPTLADPDTRTLLIELDAHLL